MIVTQFTKFKNSSDQYWQPHSDFECQNIRLDRFEDFIRFDLIFGLKSLISFFPSALSNEKTAVTCDTVGEKVVLYDVMSMMYYEKEKILPNMTGSIEIFCWILNSRL